MPPFRDHGSSQQLLPTGFRDHGPDTGRVSVSPPLRPESRLAGIGAKRESVLPGDGLPVSNDRVLAGLGGVAGD